LVILEVNSEVGEPEGPIRQAEEETVHGQGCTQQKYNLTVLIAVKFWFRRENEPLTILFPLQHYSSLQLYDLSNVAPLVSVAHKPYAVRVNSGREKKGPCILGLIAVDLYLWHEKINSLFRKLNHHSHFLYFSSFQG